MAAGVYEIVDPTSGKRYVGSSVNVRNRLSEHRRRLRRGDHPNCLLQRAFAVRGDCFVFRPLAYLEPGELSSTEQRLLDVEHSKPGGTFNIAKDAVAFMRGRKHSQEWVTRSLVWKVGNKSRTGVPSHWAGKKLSLEHIEKMNLYKRNLPEEVRAKMRQARLGVAPANKGQRQSVCGRGHEMSDENSYRRPDRGTYVCRKCAAIRDAAAQVRKRGT